MADVLSLPSPIAQLNDTFRTTFVGGRLVMTAGIANLPDATKVNILTDVRSFSDFNADNDPEGEHDFGAFETDGHKCFWKIDYYDLSLQGGSPDPGNASVTTRVLTIMLREEY
jgi:hypothetical protein